MRLVAVLAFAFLINLLARAAQTDQQRVDEIFSVYDKAGSPGCALGVIRDGAFMYRKGYGTASLELGVPLSSQSVFYMGSVSKQFTAASVVLAAEQGLLSLDDNIRKYIPELPDYGRPVTLRQMLHHTSGFRDVLGLLDMSGRSALDLHPTAELIDLVARQKALNYEPGAEYLYSNSNYFLLAEVVKRATKKPLSVFAAENIFQPLGMTHTRFYDDHTVVLPGRIPAYAPGERGSFLVDWSTNYDNVGGGGLMSSVDDLLLWDRNFYDNRLGKGTLLKEMQTRGVLNDGKQISYALGLEIGTYRGLPTVEHDGALFGYRTEILRFPAQRFTVLCLCNLATASPGRLSRKVADVYLAKELQAETGPLQSPAVGAVSDLSTFAGRYLERRSHSVFSFAVSAGTLVAQGETLRPISSNRFEGGGWIVTFDSSDSIMKATISQGDEIWFAGARISEIHLNAADLAAYAGAYKSTELDATYKLSVENGSLVLRISWNAPLNLDPLVRDEFENGDLGTLVFHRDANDRVSGLSMFQGRIRNVTFEKTN
jgi:CubicO group peptidase (beta-lactamase class C family)